MSPLIVLCPHCLTWIEIHAQSCTECGGSVEIETADPPDDELDRRLGEWLLDLGQVKLLRRGWPNLGQLVASTEGLLFIPQFIPLPNGALRAAIEGKIAAPDRTRNLLHWWSIPIWRQPVEIESPIEPPTTPRQPLRQLVFDSPGTFFISRNSIRRISVRWGRLQFERQPARMVSLTSMAPGNSLRDSLRRLIDFAPWRSIVAEL